MKCLSVCLESFQSCLIFNVHYIYFVTTCICISSLYVGDVIRLQASYFSLGNIVVDLFKTKLFLFFELYEIVFHKLN